MRNYKKRKKRRWWRIPLIILLVLVLLCSLVILIFQIRKVEVTGNVHYTEEQIEDMVIKGLPEHNSLYLYGKYKYGDTEKIPFVEKIEVELLSTQKIRIQVYEKNMVGCMEYLGSYMYFDKDGIVVESSKEKIDSVPFITGISFDRIVLYEPLDVGESEVFKRLLELTKLLTKYEITADKIHFDKDMNMTLYFENAKVLLGLSDELDSKIFRLKSLIPKLEGRKGTLHMENFDESTKNITFEVEE